MLSPEVGWGGHQNSYGVPVPQGVMLQKQKAYKHVHGTPAHPPPTTGRRVPETRRALGDGVD